MTSTISDDLSELQRTQTTMVLDGFTAQMLDYNFAAAESALVIFRDIVSDALVEQQPKLIELFLSRVRDKQIVETIMDHFKPKGGMFAMAAKMISDEKLLQLAKSQLKPLTYASVCVLLKKDGDQQDALLKIFRDKLTSKLKT